jgi:predicted nuclease with TOPRIM domain
MKKRNLNAPTTLKDLDDLGTHIITTISKVLEDYPKKADLKKEVDRLEGKIEDVASDVSDIRRRVIDLETDTVSRREFNDLKTKVLPA